MSSVAGLLVSTPSALFISELTGERNVLELRGRALPYKPLTFEGTMRAEFTWYPGNPVATVQVLGAAEKPTSINGKWKDKHVRSTNDVGIPVLTGVDAIATLNDRRVANVRNLVQAADGFRLRGQLIQLNWDEFIRQGILRRFRHTWTNREDVEWEMEFEWASRGEPVTPVAFAPSTPNLDVANQVGDAVDGLRTIAEAPFALATTLAGATNAAIETMEGAVESLSDTALKAVDAILSPAESVQLMLAALQTTKDEAQEVLDLMESVPARAMRQSATVEALADRVVSGGTVATTETTTQTAAGDITTVSVSSTGAVRAPLTTSRTETSGIAAVTQEEALEAEIWKADVRRAARNVQSVALQHEQEIISQQVRVANVGVLVAAQDDDLRDVATKFYGSPEQWKSLLLYNKLDSSRLEPGQIVLVPPLSAAP